MDELDAIENQTPGSISKFAFAAVVFALARFG